MRPLNVEEMISALSRLPEAETLRRRRAQIQASLNAEQSAVISAGLSQPRNFPANHYPDFRANSHFLYLIGQHLPSAVLVLTHRDATLYHPAPTKSGSLWHGEEKRFSTLSMEIGCEVRSLDQLRADLKSLREPMTLPTFQANTRDQLVDLMGDRALERHPSLIKAMVNARLIHDEDAIRELRLAAELTGYAHHAGLSATMSSSWAYQLRAAMETPLTSVGARLAYAPIITPRGEVLHNHDYHDRLTSSDLILADVGAETHGGWAGDVTRTWPASGRWSDTQRAVYEVVLNALESATQIARPGVEYASLHQAARMSLIDGLLDLGILKGDRHDIDDANSIALFFPHGIGHLLGLDVHDMEDLGDDAGYAEGRARRESFGWGYLRLDRVLRAGMAITIEPGFYQVPALLSDPTWAGPHAGSFVQWETLSAFSDVRGIRIEDDIIITEAEPEVLSAEIPKHPDELTSLVRS